MLSYLKRTNSYVSFPRERWQKSTIVRHLPTWAGFLGCGEVRQRIFSLGSIVPKDDFVFKLDITRQGRKCDSVLGVASGDNLCRLVR